MVTVYTDGSGVNNSKNKNYGKGGFGAYIQKGGSKYYLSKGYKNTTSNRMEIRAVLYSLKAIKNKSENVCIYSDSKYVINSIMMGWVYNWEARGWFDCKNPDLWKRMLAELREFEKCRGTVVLKHVKGHQENLENEVVLGNNIADALADYSQFKIFKKDVY